MFILLLGEVCKAHYGGGNVAISSCFLTLCMNMRLPVAAQSEDTHTRCHSVSGSVVSAACHSSAEHRRSVTCALE